MEGRRQRSDTVERLNKRGPTSCSWGLCIFALGNGRLLRLDDAKGFFLGDFADIAVGAGVLGVGDRGFFAFHRGEAGEAVEGVDEEAELGEGAAVEFEDDAPVVGDEGFFVDDLGLAGFDFAAGADFAELGVDFVEF